MTKQIKLIFLLVLSIGSINVHSMAQTNEFIIGMYGCNNAYSKTSSGQIITTPKVGNYYSSWFGVLAEDGFTTIITEHPDLWFDYNDLKRYFTLAKNNKNPYDNKGLKVIDYNWKFFKSNENTPGGINQYTLNQNNTFRCDTDGIGTKISPSSVASSAMYNIDFCYDRVYNDPLLSNTITGHFLGGEFSYFHEHVNKDIIPKDFCCLEPCFSNTEVPPQNVSDALAHFYAKRNSVGLNNQKLLFNAPVHGGYVEGFDDGKGLYNEIDYLTMKGVINPQKPEIYDESSYFSTQFASWALKPRPDLFYLGKFRSIDYTKALFKRVVVEVNIEANDIKYPRLKYGFHTNPSSVPNANHLWFLSYTSIIHGAEGVLFWDLGQSWKTLISEDVVNKSYVENAANPDRYERAHFPAWYKLYISNLSKELRYLVNKNLLSSDPSTILYSKTRYADENCVLPPSITYLPEIISSEDSRDLSNVNSVSLREYVNVHRDEEYGLKYTIRTNGTEVIMIVSNPNPYSVHNVTFNFNSLSNPLIKNATGVDMLFDDGSVTNVNSSSYKVNRGGVFNSSFNVIKKKHYNLVNGTFTSDFGPFDVKVFQFTSGPNHTYNTDWLKVWSNNGNKSIGSWSPIRPTDKFIIGDFDNNGKEDLLLMHGMPNFKNSWAVLQEFNETTLSWQWKWDNQGNNRLGADWYIDANDRFYTGDFNGDNKVDILCISASSMLVTIYSYNNGWNKIWTNNGSGNIGGWIGIRPTDKFVVANFDGNGKDNLLIMHGISNFSANWGVMQELNSTNTSWNWQWDNNGNNRLASNWSLDATHRYFVGDFNSDNKADILCASGTDTRNNIYTYNNGWTKLWDNSQDLKSIAGWALPYNRLDKILVGNIDGDARNELLLIQRGIPAYWVQTKDMKIIGNQLTYNWSNNASTDPYIYDWPLAGNGTDYYLIKANSTLSKKKYLLAIRDYSDKCNPNYIVSMYKTRPLNNFREAAEDNKIRESNANEDVRFHIYPNPGKDLFNIQSDLIESADVQFRVYNLQGQCVFDKTLRLAEGPSLEILNLESLSNGSYTLNIRTSNGELNKKIAIIK